MADATTGGKGRLPDFLIIGAAKSGTSTLYQHLTRHPRIYMSTIKEPCFFDADVAWDKGLDWYRSLFADAGPEQICGEASTNYTRWPQVPDVPARISKILPDVKLIYILRHPVDRAYSHYVHRYTKEVCPGQPFEETFEEFVEHDPMCLDSSDYLLQINQYLEYFPRESFLFLLLDDLKRDPEALLRNAFRFLGVDEKADFLAAEEVMENQATSFREGKLREHITAPLRKNPILRGLAYSVPQSWRDRAYAMLQKTDYGKRVSSDHTSQPMREETREALLERYGASNGALSEMTGLDLSHWRS
jgi:hypothetical protein